MQGIVADGMVDMSRELETIGLMVCCMAPVLAGGGVLWWKRRLAAKVSARPFEDLPRRPAGEGLRLKLLDLEDRISTWGARLAVAPILVVAALRITGPSETQKYAVGIVLSVVLAGIAWAWMRRLVGERDRCRLGFDGERYVAEELSHLIGAGYAVYHDVPFERWNIDHVLVGPGGVFSIETKTKRKPLNKAGAKQYQVIFTGKELEWPGFTDGESVGQAVLNGRSLSQWLGSAVGEPVAVIAVLTVPGWMVERKAPPNGVQVLNPKEIGKFCRDRRAVMDGVIIRRICHQLDQKCRLVAA